MTTDKTLHIFTSRQFFHEGTSPLTPIIHWVTRRVASIIVGSIVPQTHHPRSWHVRSQTRQHRSRARRPLLPLLLGYRLVRWVQWQGCVLSVRDCSSLLPSWAFGYTLDRRN